MPELNSKLSSVPPQKVTAKMKLYLALAVLMLAFVAYTEAQDAQGGIEESFARFTEQVNELGRDWAAKAKTTFEGIQQSEFAQTSRNWFQEQFEKVKSQLSK